MPEDKATGTTDKTTENVQADGSVKAADGSAVETAEERIARYEKELAESRAQTEKSERERVRLLNERTRVEEESKRLEAEKQRLAAASPPTTQADPFIQQVAWLDEQFKAGQINEATWQANRMNILANRQIALTIWQRDQRDLELEKIPEAHRQLVKNEMLRNQTNADVAYRAVKGDLAEQAKEATALAEREKAEKEKDRQAQEKEKERAGTGSGRPLVGAERQARKITQEAYAAKLKDPTISLAERKKMIDDADRGDLIVSG